MTFTRKTKLLNIVRALFKISFLEKILVKLTVNKTPESFFAKLIPNNYQYNPGTYRYAFRNEITYKLDLYDYVDWWLYFGLRDNGRNKLYQLSDKNNTIIDVGANIGETVMNFAKLILPNGEVHGFEPDAINYQRCTENLKLNKFSNIVLNNTGLGSEAGQYFIKVDVPSNRGTNKISTQASDHNSAIQLITLDQYIHSKKLKKVDLIKIDVEGYEYNVIRGGTETIKLFKPALFIELDDNNLRQQGHSAQELILLLMQLNYKITIAETNQTVTGTTDFTNCHYDIICKQYLN